MEALEPLSSKAFLVLDLPPSCAQFCPAHPKYLIVGTYSLQHDEGSVEEIQICAENPINREPPKTQSRNGSLVVVRVEGDELTIVQTVLQPSALLDLRFYSEMPEHHDILAVVSSTGTLAVFRFDPLEDIASPLKHIATSRCDDLGEDVLFLQCSWHPSLSRVMGVTTSTGLARLLHLNDEWRIQESTDLNIGNSLEAWCIAFSPVTKVQSGKQEPYSAYCGGDDSILRYTSCNLNDELSSLINMSNPTSLRGQHDAGVTAVLPLLFSGPNGGRVVVTGSYDDHLRVFSIHDLHVASGLKRVHLLADANLGGGVWRLNMVDSLERGSSVRIRILASCMHAGARIVDIVTDNGRDWTCEVMARFEEHQSMNYASDVSVPGPIDDRKGLKVISTSFYDRLLCLWEWNPQR